MDIDAQMVQMLREHRVRQADRRGRAGEHRVEGDWVLTTARGTSLNEFNVTRAMGMLIGQAGLPRIRFHGLRHTCATPLLTAGRPVHIVSWMLGHASPASTLRIYAHLLDGQGAETAALIGQILADNAPGDGGCTKIRTKVSSRAAI